MSRIAQLAQIMAIGALASLTLNDDKDLVLPLTGSDEPTERQKADLIQRREAHERARRAGAEEWQREYDAKAQTFRDERAARKAANFAKRQPKR